MNVIQAAIFYVHHTELSKFVEQAFGFKFDYLLSTAMPKAAIVEYHVTGLDETTPQPIRDKAAKLQAGQRVNDPATLLNVMVDRGIIPPGIYRISTKDQLPVLAKPKRKWSLGKLKIVGMQV